MRKEAEKFPDRHVRITDISLLEKIDAIMQAPNYKSFNKVLNEALFYGLPILYEKLFGKEEQPQQEAAAKVEEPTDEESQTDKLLIEIACCLKEIMLTGNINKSMLSSIFRTCEYDHAGKTVASEKLHAGQYAGTPDYLETYELKGLKDIWGKKK